MYRYRAFTITELLVVLVIGAVLLALAYPASDKIRKQYAKTLDVYRLKQIGGAWLSYTQENNRRLPWRVSPVPVKTMAQYLGYIKHTDDWSNTTNTGERSSIFRNEANVAAIRKLFISGYDDRAKPDPLNSFSFNVYFGHDGKTKGEGDTHEYVGWYHEIVRPDAKMLVIPAWFTAKPYENNRFSTATSSNPFRTAANPATKGHFPAVFADGHVDFVDSNQDGKNQTVTNRWIAPRGNPQ